MGIAELSPEAWWRGDLLHEVLSADDPVAEWPDSAGNSHEAVQAAGALQPVFRADHFAANAGAVEFAADRLTCGTPVAVAAATGSALIALLQIGSGFTSYAAVLTASATFRGLYFHGSTDELFKWYDGTSDLANTTAGFADAIVIYGARIDPSGATGDVFHYLWGSGAPDGADGTSAASGLTADLANIGEDNGGGDGGFYGLIGEIAVFTAPLTAGQMLEAAQDINRRYSLNIAALATGMPGQRGQRGVGA